VQLINSAKLRGSGVANNINLSFDSTTGGIIEGEYLFSPTMGVKIRAVSEKFTRTGTNIKADGNHVGLMFNVYL